LKVMWQNELQPDDCVQSIFFPAPLTMWNWHILTYATVHGTIYFILISTLSLLGRHCTKMETKFSKFQTDTDRGPLSRSTNHNSQFQSHSVLLNVEPTRIARRSNREQTTGK
jgi:hypothetical protein